MFIQWVTNFVGFEFTEFQLSSFSQVKNLLLKRMPLIVRLVHGFPPKGLKSGFVPELRLLGCIEVENNIFALPLQKDVELISIPLNAKLKLQYAKNMEQLENFAEYKRLVDKANRLLQDDVQNRLQVIDLKMNEKDSKKDSIIVKDSELKIRMTLCLCFICKNDIDTIVDQTRK